MQTYILGIISINDSFIIFLEQVHNNQWTEKAREKCDMAINIISLKVESCTQQIAFWG